MIIVRVLYGIKISDVVCREKLVEILKSLGYKSYESESDVWMKRYFNTNCDTYYK